MGTGALHQHDLKKGLKMVTNKTPHEILKEKTKAQRQYIKQLDKKIIALQKLKTQSKG